jgi:hypothetical protein
VSWFRALAPREPLWVEAAGVPHHLLLMAASLLMVTPLFSF